MVPAAKIEGSLVLKSESMTNWPSNIKPDLQIAENDGSIESSDETQPSPQLL